MYTQKAGSQDKISLNCFRDILLCLEETILISCHTLGFGLKIKNFKICKGNLNCSPVQGLVHIKLSESESQIKPKHIIDQILKLRHNYWSELKSIISL